MHFGNQYLKVLIFERMDELFHLSFSAFLNAILELSLAAKILALQFVYLYYRFSWSHVYKLVTEKLYFTFIYEMSKGLLFCLFKSFPVLFIIIFINSEGVWWAVLKE